jgi:transcriptional regulator with XRE-family HTH domain
MSNKESANDIFALNLKKLRLRFNLLQKYVSDIAGITQSVYSSYETGSTQMGIDDADNISRKVWGVGYEQFVEFANKRISLEGLPKRTLNAINESEKIKIKEQDGRLAQELDRLIREGYLNKPVTSKQLLTHMHPDLHSRKSTEITNLLIKAPRNKYIAIVDKVKMESLFQLMELEKRL